MQNDIETNEADEIEVSKAVEDLFDLYYSRTFKQMDARYIGAATLVFFGAVVNLLIQSGAESHMTKQELLDEILELSDSDLCEIKLEIEN